ncbi:MAG: translation initiation factor IF-2 associated domain-containing protein, partial [Rhodoblastus sp.]
MSETKTPGDKTLSVGPSKTLTLKRPVEQGTVRQSFSHGRTKAVVVEKVKRRTVGPHETKAAPAAPAPAAAPPPPAKPAAPSAPAKAPSGVVLRTLTEEERQARDRALADARVREEEDRRRAEADAKERAAREAREAADREAAAERKRAEEARHTKEAEAKRKSEVEARRRLTPGETPEQPAAAAP